MPVFAGFAQMLPHGYLPVRLFPRTFSYPLCCVSHSYDVATPCFVSHRVTHSSHTLHRFKPNRRSHTPITAIMFPGVKGNGDLR